MNNWVNHHLTSMLFPLSMALSMAFQGIAVADQGPPSSKIPLGVNIVQIQDDPSRFAVYAIDSDHGQILFVDTRSLSVTKSLSVGQNPTSCDIDESGNTMYVANRGSGTPSTYRISLVDLDTQTVVTNLVIPGGYLPVNVVAGRQGRLYYNSGYAVWNDGLGRALDADTGDDLGAIASIKTMMLTSPDKSRLYGQYVYTPNLGQMGVWDISTDAITQTDSRRYSPYSDNYGWAYDNYSMSDDGRYLAYGPSLFSSTNLACQYGVFPEAVYALSFDGSRAYGATSVWDTTTFATLGAAVATQPMPFSCNVMRVDRKDGLLYAFNHSDLSLYILGSTNGISERGSVCGLITPPGAVATGAQWHLQNGTQLSWQSSGATLTNVPVGVYRMEFGSIGDHWIAPSSRTTRVTSDRVITVSGNYIEKGGVSCAITPQAACEGGAAWRLTSGYDTAWHQSGETVSNVVPGAYTVRFQHIGGWAEPADRVITVISGVTTNLSAMYYVDGGLSCTIEPQEACDGGAVWRLTSGSDTNWHGSAEVVTNLEPGNYTVTFQHLDGWVESPDQAIAVVSAQTNVLSCKYYLVGETHYVSLTGTHRWPYATWAEAATNIQAAIDASIAGDSIIVTNGVYDSGGAVASGTYAMNRIMATFAVHIESVNGPTNTIIVGHGPFGPAAVRCAYLAGGASLGGFTLTNGWAAPSANYYDMCGGGVYAEGGYVSNCIISGNFAYTDGGGAYGASLQSCVIAGNSADVMGHGGGANACTLERCVLSGNSARNGGGICRSTLYSCLLTGNQAPDKIGSGNGGAVYGGTLWNCTVVSNTAVRGGGICQADLHNCIVYYNSAATDPDLGTINVGWLTVERSCAPVPIPGDGNITNEPMFVGMPDGDFHLATNSACIDSGTNAYWMSQANDLGATPRISGPSVDMGCYETVSGRGSVCGLVEPLGASDAGAQWQLLNGPQTLWQPPGMVLTNLPAGIYTIAFRPIGEHWIAPSNRTIIIASGQTTSALGNYTEKGGISCSIMPQAACDSGAAWCLTTGYDTSWHAGGETVSNLPPGDYAVRFEHIDGWVEAGDQIATVMSGVMTNLTAAYLPYGGVSCTIEPQEARDAGATWCLTSGYDTSWHGSGETITNLPPGDYAVVFQHIDGWTEAAAQVATVPSGATTNCLAVYTPYGGISCTIEPQSVVDGGAAWRLTTGYDTTWHESGETVTNLPPGWYTVAFQPVGGWITATARPVLASDGMTTNVVGEYVLRVDHYVCLNSSNPVAPYASWQTAATSIVDAVGVSREGETVWVTNGIYNVYHSIDVTNGTVIKSVNGWGTTVIDAGYPVWSNRCVHLACPGAVLCGFTIQNGFTTNCGGGVYVEMGTLTNCTISGNSAAVGGGVAMGGGGIVVGCRISGNHAAEGGGIANDSATGGGAVAHCYITDNTADSLGGGLAITCAGNVNNCLVARNTAGSNGGAVFVNGGNYGVSFYNCTVVDNIALVNGGFDYSISGAVVVNSIIYGNSNGNVNGGTYYFCCSDASSGGFGNIASDPLFVDPGAGDYHLQPNSPCVDAGANLGGNNSDLNGVPRPLDGKNSGFARMDIGCYEFASSLSDSDHDGMKDADEVVAGTDPGDGSSCFRVTAQSSPANGLELVVSWDGKAGRVYDVQENTNLISGIWCDVAGFSNLFGAGSTMAYTGTVSGLNDFYRVKVLLSPSSVP